MYALVSFLVLTEVLTEGLGRGKGKPPAPSIAFPDPSVLWRSVLMRSELLDVADGVVDPVRIDDGSESFIGDEGTPDMSTFPTMSVVVRRPTARRILGPAFLICCWNGDEEERADDSAPVLPLPLLPTKDEKNPVPEAVLSSNEAALDDCEL